MTINIRQIYQELEDRYLRISVSTIKCLLNRTLKARVPKSKFRYDGKSTPNLDEVEDAFLRYNCAIFTAFRSSYNLDENLKRNELLKKDLETKRIQFRPVRGCYREADWEYANIEYCFFAYKSEEEQDEDFFAKVYTLSARYNQDSFLYKRAGINRVAFLVATSEAGAVDLGGNIKFAGVLHTNVPDEKEWTDCSDGRFAFQLKGMLPISKVDKQIRIGEGNIFDTESYGADGLVVIHDSGSRDLSNMCRGYKGASPLVSRYFSKENVTAEDIHNKVYAALLEMKKKGCKHIGFHLSVAIDGDYVKGAALAMEELTKWVKRNNKKVKQIVIVDIYGDYGKAVMKNDK